MNKFKRNVEEVRSQLTYSSPVYVPGYEYHPLKRWIIICLVVLILGGATIAHVVFENKNAVPGLFTLLFFVSLLMLIWGLITPSHLSEKLSPTLQMRRKHVFGIFGLLCLLFFTLIGLTAPANASTANATLETGAKKPASQGLSQTTGKLASSMKVVIETKAIPHQMIMQSSNTLAKGQSQVSQEGSDGVETYTYEVIVRDGKEVTRTLKSQSVTTQPVTKIIVNGTRENPSQTTTGTGYTNVEGDHINSPSSDPAGASAQCRDGTYSYSANRRGTCSHHGGVARWL